MATYTSNYGLHQWAPEDNFLRTDFNTDLQKIDTALGEKLGVLEGTQMIGEKAKVVAGEFVGNGETMTIDLGFRPKAALVCQYGDMIAAVESTLGEAVELFEAGFSATHNSYAGLNVNTSGRTNFYMALA